LCLWAFGLGVFFCHSCVCFGFFFGLCVFSIFLALWRQISFARRAFTTMAKPFYVTTPIYYVNALPHIGHIYTTLIADTLARYHKLLGEDVYFLTGTDEHGQKIEQAAASKGIPPKAFCDQIANEFKVAFQRMGMDPDYFIRTSDESHELQVQAMWMRLEERGFIELGTHEGWYCVSDENFCTELQVQEIVKDGKTIKVSKDSGHPVEWIAEENLKFKLSAFQDKLLEFYKDNPDWITPAFRQREIEQFVRAGLNDLSVSRKKKICNWAIPVPAESRLKTEEPHSIYVWLDALTNYYTAAVERQKDPAHSQKVHCWPADIHVIGKDILKFHAIYWPAFLMAAELPLPKRIVAHGWWTKDGMKISKSLGNAFDPLEKAEEYGLDALKYFLLRESSFSDDGDYSDRNMVSRLNGELADTLGNLVLRCISRSINQSATVPTPGEFTEDDKALIAAVDEVPGVVEAKMKDADIQGALIRIFEVLTRCNQYVTGQEPWVLAKAKSPRLPTVLYVMIESLRVLALLLSPVMPAAGAQILDSLGVPPELRTGRAALRFGGLKGGTAFPAQEPPVLFPKKLKPAEAPKPVREADDATAFDIRVGRIVSVRKHTESEALYVEDVDLGEAKPRQIVSGLVHHVPEDQFKGALVLVLCNLSAANLKGVESDGMVLCAADASGKLELPQLPVGTVVGQRVTFPPLDGLGFIEGQPLAKRKVQKLMKDLRTDDGGVLHWKECKFTLPGGVCISTVLNGIVK